VHTGLLNVQLDDTFTNPFEYKDLYTRFLVIDDVFLIFIMHTVAIHANNR